jgi:hypothetical protein
MATNTWWMDAAVPTLSIFLLDMVINEVLGKLSFIISFSFIQTVKIINVKITPSIHQSTHPSTNQFTYLFVHLPACPSIHLLPLCLVYLPDAFPACLPYLLGYCLAFPAF